jgi:indole-3-glycerol phosphate synthase
MGTIQPAASDFLSRILHDKQAEIAARRDAEPAARLAVRAAAALPPLPALEALRGERLRVIAEVKRGSPSKGIFDAGLDAAAQAERYAAGGAAAVSVLTDGPHFQGSLDDLRTARVRVGVPLLRKDFIIDPYQLLEARAAGADLVLLIVAALGEEQLAELLDRTHDLGMEALVEVNTEAEARRAAAMEVPLAGINNRNLHTFEVDMRTTERLRPLLPSTTVVASLSGIARVDDAVRMRTAGADAVLVGEALVRAPDPGALLSALNGVA